MRATAATDVGLKSTLHDYCLLEFENNSGETQMLPDGRNPCQCTIPASRPDTPRIRTALRPAGAYARVASPTARTGAAGRESGFSTGVEKTVENKGFLPTQA
jgi:hypothetical protein